jgi:aconitate hydratase
VVPPDIGIVHQVNLEYLFRGLLEKDGVLYPDTLVGTDSHTTMINGIGVVAWGVGGIEGEAAMLGQPVYFLTPDVIGVELTGKLNEGITATDLVLTVTEMLRKEKVVGKFVEFFGEGTASLTVPDRATIGNMAPEYGATMGFFPVDEKTVDYLLATGRAPALVERFEAYFRAQQLFGVPKRGDIDYSKTLTLDLSSIVPSLAGPKRPQDRIELGQMKLNFGRLFSAPPAENGFGKKLEELTRRYPVQHGQTASSDEQHVRKGEEDQRNAVEMVANRPTLELASHDELAAHDKSDLGHGDVLIAAITSCTNTSNPGVLLAAGLLAKKAVEKGLSVHPRVKTSLAPGSRVVTAYLEETGLTPYLDKLGFNLAAYGCTTCIGNSGDLRPEFNQAITGHDLICAAVLSGNRNFEARIHPNIRANYLASPPLVVAFAIAGKVNIDLTQEPLGTGKDGLPVYLRDIWPSPDEVAKLLPAALNADTYRRLYADFTTGHDLWNGISIPRGQVYTWPESTYIAKPPFFDGFSLTPGQVADIRGARALLLLGDSVTTDHISPAGSFKESSPAGQYLLAHGVQKPDFNSYGSRRGNHEVMIRGTFANVRVKNLMLPPREDGSRVEGGYTLLDGKQTTVYDAAQEYMARGVPTVIFAGEEYGTGSSRDWAAKGTLLLGVKAVIAKSFERIHRNNLVGMGVLPLQFPEGSGWEKLKLTGEESFDIKGIAGDLKPRQEITLIIKRQNGESEELTLKSRIDTPIEVEYYKHGGILPYVLRDLLQA